MADAECNQKRELPEKGQNNFQLGMQAYHQSKTNITYSVA